MSRVVFATADQDASDVRPTPFEDLPDLLTVPEAAAYLRVGRNTAYELIKQWRRSGGRQGLASVSVGRGIRVHKTALKQFVAVCAPSAPAPERPVPDTASASSLPTQVVSGHGLAGAGR